jgi:hypothetical protein
MAKRSTKAAYERLYDDPTLLGNGTALVVLFPNGRNVLWVKSADGRRGMELRFSDGPAGLMVGIHNFLGTPGMTLGGNLEQDAEVYPPKGERRPDFRDVSLVQYRSDEHSQRFRAWSEGRAEHPGEKPAEEGSR